ncbi:MAG: ACP S-malonyltransferase [Dethiobacteria bacterium]|nr:ACP S-malonyltransferase [Bacillota bacterium]
MKTAVLFPGQGAQFPGMGLDFYNEFPQARAVYDLTAAALGEELLNTIFQGPAEKLQQTEYTQPAILSVSMAIYSVLESLDLKPSGLAGLSLGEYSALVAAGAISYNDALPLVQKRGIYMQDAVPAGEGSMAAIMGVPHHIIEEICREAAGEGLVSPANYNCPGQTVVSGNTAAVNRAGELARKAGAKRITALKVSAPFHCSLLECVEERLSGELEKIIVCKPSIPVVFNVSAEFAENPEEIKANLIKQVSSPILWEQSIRVLIDAGIERFIGLGPGSSLSRLMKRIAPEIETYSVEKVEDVRELQQKGVIRLER